MKILIVDDEYYVVREILSNTDWKRVRIDEQLYAFNAVQARTLAENNKDIDIILTDIEMPRQNGLDFIRWVYSESLFPVILLLTGHESFDYAHTAIELHVLEYLTKPVDIEKLEISLVRAVRERRRRILYPELFDYSQEERDDENDPAILITNTIRQNLSSPDLNRQLIADVVHMHPDYISALFKKKTGVSLSAYILNERLKLAEVMLTNTSMTLQQISAKAGFSSPTYFHRQFKNFLGLTPQQYRQSQKGQ